MKYDLFVDVALSKDMPEKKLKRGDVATIVEYHPIVDGEDGYSLEIFNTLGETITTATVPESSIEPLTADEIFHVRPIAVA